MKFMRHGPNPNKGGSRQKQKRAEELRSHGYVSFLSHGVAKFKNIHVRNLKAEDAAARAEEA
jgi:hypothetical protein